jgi:hypothetical protein
MILGFQSAEKTLLHWCLQKPGNRSNVSGRHEMDGNFIKGFYNRFMVFVPAIIITTKSGTGE